MLRTTTIVAALTLVLAGGVAAAAPFPATIALPQGFQPEGIAIGGGTTFYVGSIPTGSIYRGDLRTGAGSVFVEHDDRAAIGLALDDSDRLFVAGGATGGAFVYDASTGADVAQYTFASAPTFVNDVVVTETGAYFTDSQRAVLYRIPIDESGSLGAAETIPLSGDFQLQPGFNANGIDAVPSGRWLVIVQSNTGKLFRVDPATGATAEIALAGGESVRNGDGILLDGNTLYVVQNRSNAIAVVALDPSLTSGRVVTRLTDERFDVPTTIDEFGRFLYAVNARFGTPSPETAEYQVLQLRKP